MRYFKSISPSTGTGIFITDKYITVGAWSRHYKNDKHKLTSGELKALIGKKYYTEITEEEYLLELI